VGEQLKVGRPRREGADDRILAAARERLSTDGFERMSLEDVARDAGVSRPTIYRRWPSKADLAIAAVQSIISAGRAEPTGDLRTDLRAIAASLHDGFLQHNYLGLLGTALVERDHHPEILEGYRERLMNPRRSSIRDVIERAVRDGQLKSDVDIELGVAMLVGAFYSLTLSKERPESPTWIDRVTDGVIGALIGSTQPSEQQSREA
jgi:AcrR family transcriptional regulator